MVLTISQTVPEACLIGGEGAALAVAVASSGGVWFAAHPDEVLVENDDIVGWRARVGDADLRPTAPNIGGARFGMEPAGFLLRTGVHCGFTLASAVVGASRFTAAVIFAAPDDDIRSLFALNTGASNDMIFLSESDGQIFAKDRAGGVAVHLPAPRRHGRWRMAIVSYTGHALHLWADGAQAVGQGAAIGLTGPLDFFVGCRSNRSGLAKTLGAGVIRDVLLWPSRALLAEDSAPELAALHRYFRWSAA
ncbi:MAG: hypothetical protein U5N55_05850 [Cypionkella sp.]|nr:hypothetical protein [Cypionkella sp.]